MHDTILLNKIYDAVQETCKVNKIKKVNILTLIVSEESHIDDNTLLGYLQSANNTLFGDWTKVDIFRENFQDQSVIIHSIQGEQYSD